MKLLFVTSNKHKVEQARAIFRTYDIQVTWKKATYDENSDDTMQEIARKASKLLAKRFKMPVMVEDTGIFFAAYPGFPGALPKFVFNAIGYDGIFRLLRGKKKKASFVSAIGFCRPSSKPIVVEGHMPGRIMLKVKKPRADVLPFERIFIPEGKNRTLVEMPFEEKLPLFHRSKAMHTLAKRLSRNL